MIGEVNSEPVEAIRDHRAGRTASRVVGPEHEMVDEELRAPLEQALERCAPVVGLKAILLADPNPWQALPPLRQLIAAPRELLLRLEQIEPRFEPFVACPCRMRGHCPLLLRQVSSVVRSLDKLGSRVAR